MKYRQPELTLSDASRAFHSMCLALISDLLGWKAATREGVAPKGFLGDVIAFTGAVDQGVKDDLKVCMLIWLRGSPTLARRDPDLSAREKLFRSQATTPNTRATWATLHVGTPANSSAPSWNPTLLRLLGPCHDLKVFHTSSNMDETDGAFGCDRWLMLFMMRSVLPPWHITNIMSTLMHSTTHVQPGMPASLAMQCASSYLFNGGVSTTEMVRILANLDHGYSSHSFVELYWDGLVRLVKKEFQLVGGNRWVFSHSGIPCG
jgi:hypothetical protein